MAAKPPERNTRASIACTVCRARKHRCSGEKPRCAQCKLNDLVCEWPAQQKRGPPKQYIHSLEARLLQTENVLVSLLSQIAPGQLDAAFQQPPLPNNRDQGSLENQAVFNYEGPLMSQKEVSNWKQFPLDSPENVRNWWQHKVVQMPDPSPWESTENDVTITLRENSVDATASTAPPLLHGVRIQSMSTYPFAQDGEPQSFGAEASGADASSLPFEAENQENTYYDRGTGSDMERVQESTGQSATGNEGVLNFSEEFKQDYIW